MKKMKILTVHRVQMVVHSSFVLLKFWGLILLKKIQEKKNLCVCDRERETENVSK